MALSSSSSSRPAHTIPISQRPPPTLLQRAHLVLFNASFLALILVLHAFQLCAIPSRTGKRLAKEAFGSVLVAIVALFGPSRLVITVQQDDGPGGVKLEELVERDARGKVVRLRLDREAVLVSNHQVRRRVPRFE